MKTAGLIGLGLAVGALITIGVLTHVVTKEWDRTWGYDFK